MDPNNPHDRKLIAIANLRALAADLERDASELVYTDSLGIATPIGETDTFVFAIHTRIGTPAPDRTNRIVGALKAAMAEVGRHTEGDPLDDRAFRELMLLYRYAPDHGLNSHNVTSAFEAVKAYVRQNVSSKEPPIG